MFDDANIFSLIFMSKINNQKFFVAIDCREYPVSRDVAFNIDLSSDPARFGPPILQQFKPEWERKHHNIRHWRKKKEWCNEKSSGIRF